MGAYGHPRTSLGNMLCVFISCMACLYVGGRLWIQSTELHGLEQQIEDNQRQQHRKTLENQFWTAPVDQDILRNGVLHVSSRPLSGPGIALEGDSITSDLPVKDPDPNLAGQIDSLDAGLLKGWACVKGQQTAALQVQVYVDGKQVGATVANRSSAHHIVRRLCKVDSQVEESPDATGVAFQLKLPELKEGKHEVRAFLVNQAGTAKHELNQSPLPFLETRDASGSQEMIKRKDAIIRVRNAQVAALWDELHIKQPWRNALQTESNIGLPDDSTANETRALVVIGVNSGIGVPDRRASLRKTWVKTGAERQALEERGIFIRFVIGYSDSPDHPDEDTIQQEIKQYKDILRIDTLDTYEDLSKKTVKMFSILPEMFKADFYFKVDDDVAVNVEALETYLKNKRGQGNLYAGCMKSGQVLTDKKYKWYEPEYWRFGDPSGEGYINYPRHAAGQIYGVSAPVARYIGHNAAILHKYANEDVSVGSWLVGLDVLHQDERRFCCDSDNDCKAQTDESNLCMGYYERQCAGICNSETRLEGIWKKCLDKPLESTGSEKGR